MGRTHAGADAALGPNRQWFQEVPVGEPSDPGAGTAPGAGLRETKNPEKAYGGAMRDELVIDMRLTQLMALDANLTDVRRALVRAARIRSGFSGEVRALLAQVDDLERRVMAEVIRAPDLPVPRTL